MSPSLLEKRVLTLERNQTELEKSHLEMKMEMGSNQRIIENHLDVISNQIKTLTTGMVLRVEFQPIRSIVYGGVAVVLIAVMSALIGMVIVNSTSLEVPPTTPASVVSK